MKSGEGNVVDPFGEIPPPWWRRLSAAESPKYAPKRFLRVAGLIGGALVLALPAHHRLVALPLYAALTALPPVMVEAWFRRRRLRQEQQLLQPGGREAASAFGAPAGPVNRDQS